MPTIPFTNRDRGVADFIADRVNRALVRGAVVTVDGRMVAARGSGDAAVIWNNGTLGFSVRARNGRPGSFDDVWVKRGGSATVVIEEA
jgi:hypothetical protein